MALDYGKMEFAVSFKPITAFPLDSRSYYESLAAAQEAAAGAVEAGSDQGTIYFGQTLVVVENGVAQMLQVQPDGTLSEIGGKIEIDEHQFAIDENTGKLNLFGFADAVAGAQLVVEEIEVEGQKVKQLKWVKPDTTTVDGLATAIADLETAQEALSGRISSIETNVGAPAEEGKEASGLFADVNALEEKIDALDTGRIADAETAIKAVEELVGDENSGLVKDVNDLKDTVESLGEDKANASDVYTKSEVYTKEEADTAIGAAVAQADHLKRKIVEKYEDIQAYIDNPETKDADQYIYMVPTIYSYTSESNKYDEYIYVNGVIEPVGSWAVDLADYVSETEFAEYLKAYYTSAQVDDILKAYATIASVTAEFEKYYTIEQVDAFLEKIYTSEEVDALLADVYKKSEIDTKFEDYYTQTQIDEKFAEYYDKDATDEKFYNKTEIESKLGDYYTKTEADAQFVEHEDGKSLVSDTEIAKLATVEENAQENYVKSVDSHFSVTDSGELQLKSLSIGDVTDLQKKLDEKVSRQYFTVTDEETGESTTVEGALLSPTDKQKLDSLVIGENGVEISGKVNAANVEGLNEWITQNRNSVEGLYSESEAEKVTKAISDLEALTASVTQNTADISGLKTKVSNIETNLTNFVLATEYNQRVSTIEDDITLLKDAMTWKALTE